MAFDQCAARRVVLSDSDLHDPHAAALAEEPDRGFVSQGHGELADVCVRLPRDPSPLRRAPTQRALTPSVFRLEKRSGARNDAASVSCLPSTYSAGISLPS
jgi:hypothetical protein